GSPRSPCCCYSMRRYAPRHLHSFPTRRSSDLNSQWCDRLQSAVHRVGRRADGDCRERPPPGTGFSPGCWDGGCSYAVDWQGPGRSEEHTSELQSREKLVCRLLLAKKKTRASTS